MYCCLPALGQPALVVVQKRGPTSKGVGVVVLSKALAISQWSRVRSNMFFISLYFCYFFLYTMEVNTLLVRS